VAAPAPALRDKPDYSRKHRHYQGRCAQWRFNRDHYEGPAALTQQDRTAEYLPQFQTEATSEYDKRVKRSRGLYDNLVKRAINAYQSQLFRERVDRERLDGKLKSVTKNVDLYGTSADDFFQRVAERAQLYGVCFVLADSPRAVRAPSGGPISEAAGQLEGIRPWFELVEPTQVIDWAIEQEDPLRRGRLNWVVICDPDCLEPGQPFEEPKVYTRYRVYSLDQVLIIRDYGDRVSEDALVRDGSEIPLVPFYDQFDAPMCGSTIIDDVAYSSNALWQSWSGADEAFHYQCFALLLLVTDSDMAEVKVGASRAIKLPVGSSGAYLSPGSAPFEAHEKRVAAIRERVADLVFSRTSRQLPTAQVESAEKRDIDREEFLALLAGKARNFEQAEALCWQALGSLWGVSPEKAGEVAYNRKFKVDARDADEWVKFIAEGIIARVKWYMAENPDCPDEETAWKAIRENLEAERELSELRRTAEEKAMELEVARAAGATSLFGEGGDGEGRGGDGAGGGVAGGEGAAGAAAAA
jgi:hypothetical protein